MYIKSTCKICNIAATAIDDLLHIGQYTLVKIIASINCTEHKIRTTGSISNNHFIVHHWEMDFSLHAAFLKLKLLLKTFTNEIYKRYKVFYSEQWKSANERQVTIQHVSSSISEKVNAKTNDYFQAKNIINSTTFHVAQKSGSQNEQSLETKPGCLKLKMHEGC